MTSVYQSVAHFYADDERRRASRELDFGVWWFAARLPRVPWRVSWVEATGEVYAVRLDTPIMIVAAAGVALDGGGERGPLIVLARDVDESTIRQRLDGWADVCGQPSSLDWVRGRLRGDEPRDVA